MTDPVSSNIARMLSRQALSKGLHQLLKSGPQRGMVLQAQSGGKALIKLSGGQFPLQLDGQTLKAGQRILLRLANNQIALEILSQPGDSASPSKPSMPHTLAAQLSQMGLGGANFEAIANALLSAGIPLDKAALRQLAQALPNLTPQAFHALAFLLSRQFPISDAVVQYLARLLSQKPRIKENADAMFQSMDALDDALANDGDTIDPDARRNLNQHREQALKHLLALQENNDPDFEEELKESVQSALTSAEASIGKGGIPKGLPDALLRLMAYLMRLQTHYAGTAVEKAILDLIQHAQQLQDSLIGQGVKNAPPSDSDQPHIVYFTIPVLEQSEIRDLEIRYQAQPNDEDSGTLEFRLELSALGPLHVSMQWSKPNLSLTIASPREEVAAFIKPALETLKEHLQKQGYLVDRASAVTREIPDTLEPEEPDALQPPALGLDIRG